jgi:hypothetical protein
MKIKSFVLVILIATGIFFLTNNVFEKKKDMNILLLPSLPKPIAKEYALITSAGQSTDAYIISDIANQLMIHNYFMPQARETDLKGINTVVLVVGYSPFGKKLNGINNEGEKKRIMELLEKSKEENLVVITVYIGGKQRREKETDELLRLICPYTNYLISTKESDKDSFLSELATESKIPLTLVSEVNELSEPFASAFR